MKAFLDPEEYLAQVEGEELASWWGFMLAAKSSAEERQMMRENFAVFGMIVDDTEILRLMDTARDTMKREFNKRGIPLPS